MPKENKIQTLLIDSGICTEDSIIAYFPKVRDRDDISVFKCTKSEVIFLSGSDHAEIDYYNKKENFKYWGAGDRKAAILSESEDTQRRYEQFKVMVANKKWLDIGTGAGGILDQLSPIAAKTSAVEPQEEPRKILSEIGYKIYRSVNEVEENDFEVITLFHVLEHFTDPINMLKIIRSKMAKGGKIIIEVPHAKDFLLSFLNNDAFKAFTFWSEHLILHTKESLNAFLRIAGFSNISVNGFQRYPLANHLYWLAHHKPGGHVIWKRLNTPALDAAYSDMLSGINSTDTLIAIAENQ